MRCCSALDNSIYPSFASADDRDIDTLKQLFRRLSKVVYHYRAKDGSFCVYEEDMSQYTSYENMKLRVHGKEELANDGYIELSNAEQQRIDDLFSNAPHMGRTLQKRR